MPHRPVRYEKLRWKFARRSTHATQVKIRGVSYGGTGCPQGTMSSQINSDRTVMTLIFDAYIASIGPGIAVTEQRKNCQLNVDIEYPGGFQYSILSADYRGYSAIQKGVSGTLKSTYYFSGDTAQVRSIQVLMAWTRYADTRNRPRLSTSSTGQQTATTSSTTRRTAPRLYGRHAAPTACSTSTRRSA